jgi:hypothetical protein
LTAPERSPVPAPERSPIVPALPASQQLQSPPSSKERRTAAPPASSAPPVVILDTSSTNVVSPPVQGFTFGFEVNEDLLKENEEERLLDQDSNGDTGAVIPQNSVKDNDNVMMKNLLSLTSKSQDNDSNRSSEPLKSETEDEVEEEMVNSGLDEDEEEGRELRKDKGICLDFSSFHEEEIDVNKFNYDVILGFVSKAWEMVNMELKTGSPTIYYSS